MGGREHSVLSQLPLKKSDVKHVYIVCMCVKAAKTVLGSAFASSPTGVSGRREKLAFP